MATTSKFSDGFNRRERMKSVYGRDALEVYRPSIYQLPIHRCSSKEIVIRGGKRAGKSICAAVEVGSRMLGRPVHIANGATVPFNHRISTPDDPLTFWVIGLNVNHIGKTIHRLLFARGMRNSLRVIRDNGKWRTWNEADPKDEARSCEKRQAGPVIPPRYIEKTNSGELAIQWENKRGRVFQSVRLTNGAIIYAFPSTADHPGMGDAVDGIWINEDIANPEHMKEWQDRLIDRDGWLIWDAWPQMQNMAIVEMLERAEEQADEGKPDISAFQLISHKNPFAKEEAKRRGLRRMGDEEEIARRDRGELLKENYMIYEFFPKVHLIEKKDVIDLPDKRETVGDLLTSLYSQSGRFPRGWSRYLAIDPSHSRTGILSFVVPPTEAYNLRLNQRIIVEWEFVGKRMRAKQIAEALKPKMQGYAYEAFVMDQNRGRQTNEEGRNAFVMYSESFEACGYSSRLTGSGFMPGQNKPEARRDTVRGLLQDIRDGWPMLSFCSQSTWETQREFTKYVKKVLADGTIVDEPVNPRKHDLMAAMEYGCAYIAPLVRNSRAYRPAPKKEKKTPGWAQKILNETTPNHGRQQIHLGPGAAA